MPEFLDDIIKKNLNCIRSIKTPNDQTPLFNGGSVTNINHFSKYLESFKISKKDEKDYLDTFRIENIVKKYSDHIPYPVKLIEEGKEKEVKSLNSASALWMRNKKDIKPEQYEEFYNHLGGIGKPWNTIHNTTEGIVSFTNLLFIPLSLIHISRCRRAI